METEIRTNREKNHALQRSKYINICVQDGRSAAQKSLEGITRNFAGRRPISFRNREALQKIASIEKGRMRVPCRVLLIDLNKKHTLNIEASRTGDEIPAKDGRLFKRPNEFHAARPDGLYRPSP